MKRICDPHGPHFKGLVPFSWYQIKGIVNTCINIFCTGSVQELITFIVISEQMC